MTLFMGRKFSKNSPEKGMERLDRKKQQEQGTDHLEPVGDNLTGLSDYGLGRDACPAIDQVEGQATQQTANCQDGQVANGRSFAHQSGQH